jgi:hypothetical protein
MRTKNTKLETLTMRFAQMLVFTVLLMLASGSVGSSFAQEQQSKVFLSAAEASNALFQAVQSKDEPALEAILGAGKDVTSASDGVEDELEREQFSRKYQEMHRLVREADGSTVLYIGAENWPFPIPLLSKNGGWYFDSKIGVEEIKFRRVGENEATAIEVCEEFAIAKNAAAIKAASKDPITRFAENLASTGTANADNTEPTPFHGYYFRVLTGNSASAAGGSVTKGLRLIAYPAEYQSSGVKTFVVTWKGIVFEKDLGSETTTLAPQMKTRTGTNWLPSS